MTLVNDKLKNHLQCVQSSQPYQKLIDHALELEQRGGQINMCNALEELRQGEVLSNFTLSNVSFVFSFKPFRLKWNFT